MLRITDGMMVNNTRRHLNSNLLRLDEYERQISSGRTISRPSDNPAGTVKSLRLRTSLMEGEQYLDNINEALSFMQTTDSSLNDVDEIIQTIRERTVQAATGTNDKDAFNAIAKEIDQLQDQLKIIANATYGSKYIFAGTNVTEVPYYNGKWNGNEDWLSVEIGVGVKADINIPQMKKFFNGTMDYTQDIDAASGISSLEAHNLKEGQYTLGTQVAPAANPLATSAIRESQSYLTAVPNNNSFFYQDIQHPAILGIGRGLFDFENSNANQLVLKVNQPLGTKLAGVVTPLANGDISTQFDLSGLPVGWTATYNDNGLGVVSITFAGATALVGGETVKAAAPPPAAALCYLNGNNYVPASATYKGITKTWKPANDATFSGSLAIEVKSVDQGPHLSLKGGSDANGCIMTVDQSLYTKEASGAVKPLYSDQDITAMFDMSTLPAGWTATYNIDGQGNATVNFRGPQPPAVPAPAVINNTIKLKPTENLCNSAGDKYIPVTATFDGIKWNYQGVSEIRADIKGHVYGMDGTLRDVELKNVRMNMEAEVGEAIFSIDVRDIDSSGNPAFTNDLVVWNNGSAALGGINIRTAALKAGDKTILNFGSQVAAIGAEQVNLDYNFTDINGNQVGNGGLSYVFNTGTMDNKTKALQFFTMDQQTGVVQDASITFKTNTLGTSASVATFDYTEGLFGYVKELCGTIESGKIPQIGNMLKGTDTRLQELLYHRSTIGARINRLELQQSRLQNSETTLTDLLSKNEDTDQAKAIMELKMQENVYQASLSVGARIIQPTLIDFLK